MKKANDGMARLGRYDVDMFIDWLVDGLANWPAQARTFLAFDPICCHFSVETPIEPQLAALFTKLPPPAQDNFLYAVASIARLANEEPAGLKLRHSMQQLTGLIGYSAGQPAQRPPHPAQAAAFGDRPASILARQ